MVHSRPRGPGPEPFSSSGPSGGWRGLLLETILIPALLFLPSSPTPAQGQTQRPPCTSVESRQFDFWVGEWEVLRPDGTPAGENTIRKILNGCVLHERYRTPAGYVGESFNVYDASRGAWHQTWVDGAGALLVLEGGLRNGAMILEGETVGPEGSTLQRITWTRVEEGPDRVRQLWESSTDGGRSWRVVFDGLYRRKSGGAGA